MKEDMGTVEYASLLFDFYGSLLNDSQREIMSLYHEDNFSLSEIAAEMGMSRQAVHYTLKKAEHALAKYEDKLGLIAAYNRNQQYAAEAATILAGDTIGPGERERLLSLIGIITE